MFEMILFGLVCLCGVVMLACKHIKAVPAGASQAVSIANHDVEPWYLDYARSFFPVLLIVFLLRGLVAEPFRIPSGSMLPTLEVGDFILVNKYRYGIRLPILHNKIIEVGDPKRGDIMVFRVPTDNETHYIKRVIGLPGDVIEYKQKRLFINGEEVQTTSDGEYTPYSIHGRSRSLYRFKQAVPPTLSRSASSRSESSRSESSRSESSRSESSRSESSRSESSRSESSDPLKEFSILVNSNKLRSAGQNRWEVPQGNYFMMGDNRDNSLDSRRWGTVPQENIVGEAFFIWFHYYNSGDGLRLSRVGEDI